MTKYSQKIKDWLQKKNAAAEFLCFEKSVHSVEEAVTVSGYPIETITKSIVMLTQDDDVVIAMVPANYRASTERVRKCLGLNERPRIATAEEVEKFLGQQVGGNTPFNAPNATIIVDPKLLEKDWVVTGGGDAQHLVKISIEELSRIIEYNEARVRK